MSVKRLVRRLARSVTPQSRERQLRSEVRYWRRWFATGGLEWPEDYPKRFDPGRALQDWISAYVDRLDGDTIEILDVGSGPLTGLGKTHPRKRLQITAVDVLADAYNALMDEFGVEPPIRSKACDAEKLSRFFGDRKFDIVHAENSIDHTNNAVAALREMLAVTRPGGFLLLLHAEHEGLNQDYSSLHQWDFTCEDGHFIVTGPGRRGARHDMTDLLASEADVKCWLEDGGVYAVISKH